MNFIQDQFGLLYLSPRTQKLVPIPLKSVSITASVVHAVAQGVVKANEDAQRDYDAAVSNQQTAFLGGEVKQDIFKLKIGFLKPNSIAKVVVGYVTEVNNDPDTNSIRFFMPTTVAPRYVPGSETDQRSTDLAGMSHSADPPAPLSIKVVAAIQGGIKAVRSLSHHKIRVESRGPIPERIGWTKAVVTLVDHEGKTEFVILLDRSGSMDGNCIRMARTALQLFLHSMPADFYFNIIGFGNSFQVLFYNGSRKYNEDTLRDANWHAQHLNADLGGTEILAPLSKIYSYPCIPGYTRQVFVLSDGENSSNSRLFALGIGSSCSRHLIQGIADAGKGTSAFVENEQVIHSATLNLLKNALQPSLNDVKVEWVGVSEEELNPAMTLCGYNKPLHPTAKFLQSPKRIQPIFDGRQMVVLAIFPPSLVQPNGVKITATSPDGPLTLKISVNPNSETSEILMLHKLAAIKLVRELELERFSQPMKQQIIALAVEHGLTSKYTSYIAVDHLGDHYPGPMQRRSVPSQYPVDQGIQHKFRQGTINTRWIPKSTSSIQNATRDTYQLQFSTRCLPTRSRSRSRSRSTERNRALQEYQDDIEFDSLVVRSEEEEIIGKTWPKNVFATLLAIHFLRGLHQWKDLWELVATKAMKWMEQNCTSVEIMKDMEIATKKLTMRKETGI
ncbi:von Willebrand factor A domain-containing protein 5A [Folsomia candida]|uniref:von Willebrand factor A domain-containing protein 5A n=1 Tax=Folsomia candida TaxID=158441 RepID=A0A226DZH1_FOLCA|nr:von Willebrand factor A domain-containing protein 5A [Folsomia candida]